MLLPWGEGLFWEARGWESGKSGVGISSLVHAATADLIPSCPRLDDQLKNSATTMWLSLAGQVRVGMVSLLNTARTVRPGASNGSRPTETAGTPSSENLSRPTPK